MDRIIEVKVFGNHLSKDNKYAGVRGEGNITKLRITFDEGWGGYTKTITFWDALGGNAVKRIQGIDLLEEKTISSSTYITPIPPEAMCYAGEMSFAIDGYTGKKRQRSISGTLVVKDSPIALAPIDPTPTQAEQLQVQIDSVITTIQNAFISSEKARTSEINAKSSEENAKNSADSALNSLNQAKEYAEEAEEHSTEAQSAVGKTSYIGDNGNWFAWNGEAKAFYDTGVKAQAGSTVYVGDNPSEDADVWIDPNGASYEYFTIEEIEKIKEIFMPEVNDALLEIISIQEELMTPDGNEVEY